MTKKILSETKSTKDNHVFVELHHDCCLVKDQVSKKELLRGVESDGLYQLQLNQAHSSIARKSQPSSPTSTINSPKSSYFQSLFAKNVSISKIDLWHMTLGHPNQSVMKQMLRNENVSFKNSHSFCDACLVGKSKNTTYNLSLKTTTKPLELIHFDAWGPSPILSKDGFHYYVHFMDDFSNFTWIFPLKIKPDVKETFLNFQKLVERKFETKIKTLQSDWGGEYRRLAPILSSLRIYF